jgi:hypothetical protein
MMGIIRKFMGVALALSMLLGFCVPAAALAASATGGVVTADCSSATDCVNQGVGETCTGSSCSGTTNNGSLTGVIKTVLDILSAVVGVAAVIMIVIGGFRYVLSGGDSNATTGAKNTIIFAIVGLIIAILAQVLVQFVLAKTSKA